MDCVVARVTSSEAPQLGHSILRAFSVFSVGAARPLIASSLIATGRPTDQIGAWGLL